MLSAVGVPVGDMPEEAAGNVEELLSRVVVDIDMGPSHAQAVDINESHETPRVKRWTPYRDRC